jgi:hypothetical protein
LRTTVASLTPFLRSLRLLKLLPLRLAGLAASLRFFLRRKPVRSLKFPRGHSGFSFMTRPNSCNSCLLPLPPPPLFPAKYQAQEIGIGEPAVVLPLADDHQVHGRDYEHSLVAGANRRNHISWRFPT